MTSTGDRDQDVRQDCRAALARAHQMGSAGDHKDAIPHFLRAIELEPSSVEAHKGLGETLLALKRFEDAAQHYRRAMEIRPDCVEALCGLANLFLSLRKALEATVYLAQASRLAPNSPSIYNSLGLALADAARFSEADAAYHNSLALDPRQADVQTNLGTSFLQQGRLREAVTQYEVALWLKPDSVSTRWNRALAWLTQGKYELGWQEYEWRWKRAVSPMRPFVQPQWDGSDLHGKTILLWNEQGLGDSLQFVRYAKLLHDQGGRVLLEVPAPLDTILRSCDGVDEFLAEGATLPDFDVHAPLLGLPHRCRTTLESVPSTFPYLSADPIRLQQMKKRLADFTGLKIGIAWQGNPNHQWDRYRSVPLSEFKPLSRLPGVHLISLQRGPGTEQLAKLRNELRVETLIDSHLAEAEAFAETAALMEGLDLIITVDTATAHLAGALGRPTWILLSTICDWRWMRERSDSPWYPTVRLFRQEVLNNWKDLLLRVASELRD